MWSEILLMTTQPDMASGSVAPKKLNAADVRAALKAYYCQPEYGIVFEVARSTGHAARRHLDALAMDLWPSRGLAIHGIEVKVSRSDFRSEIKQPEKSEEIAEFCDYFWIAAPVGIVPIEELPKAWGLFEVNDKGHIVIRKQAEKTEAKPVTRAFMAAIMRCTGRAICGDTLDAMLTKERNRIYTDYDKKLQLEAGKVAGNRTKNAENYERMVSALGEDPLKYFSDAAVVDAIKAVRKSGVVGAWNALTRLNAECAEMVKNTAEAMKSFDVKDKL